MKWVSAAFAYYLVATSIGMSLWGIFGFIEYFSDVAIVIPLQNKNFPTGTQFIHWLLITIYGLTYLIGYFRRWKYTPNAMLIMCSCLATMCFIQTFDFMVREDRYIAFAFECMGYTVKLLYLFRSERMKKHFGLNL